MKVYVIIVAVLALIASAVVGRKLFSRTFSQTLTEFS
jgi:hypothetical protein